jgi:hypothetical protein
MSGTNGTAPSRIWQPSSARRIFLDGFLPLPRGTVPAAPTLFAWPAKDPGDTLDYEIDICQALAGNDADSVTSVTVAVSPVDTLVVGAATGAGTVAVLWLSGGEAGTTYAVQVVMTTVTGRILARTVLLPVQSLAPPVVPVPTSSSLSALSGVSITDAAGDPILVSA